MSFVRRERGIGKSSRIALSFARRARIRVLIIVATSVITGFGEASLLYLIVRSATALAAGERRLPIHVAFIHLEDVTRTQATLVAAALLGLLLTTAAINAWTAATLTAETTGQVRRRVAFGFLGASWDRQAATGSSRLQELGTNHTNQLSAGLQASASAITSGVNFSVYLLTAAVVNPAGFFALILAAGGIAALLRPLRTAIRRISKRNLNVGRRFNEQVTEAAVTARDIRAYGVGSAVGERMAATADQLARQVRLLRFLSRIQPLVYQYLALGFVVLGLQAAGGSTGNVTELGAVVLLLVRSLSYSQQLNTALQTLNEAYPYLEDLRESLDDLAAHEERSGSKELPAGRDLVVDGVSYRYGDGPPVLKDVSLRISEGECIGIVGRSGSGKSTLLQVLLLLRAPTSGQVSIGGISAQDLRSEHWHRLTAFVPQDNHLIAGTVAENIAFFRSATEDQVIAAARGAHLHDDIVGLADGYETRVGGGSGDLSGGQRQRLGLARALLGKPSIIILDEPTSALDMRSEMLVQETLHELHGEVTMVIVAHRISTMAICDRILVLENGTIAAEGHPDHLEKTSPFYAEAVRLARRTGGT